MMLRLSFSFLLLGVITAHSTSLRRRLNDQRGCPQASLRYCSDPSNIMLDPTVACDWDTCLWSLDLLDPDAKPALCVGITIVDVNNFSDYLEPCYWWEVRFGALKPSMAPTVSPAPTMSVAPSPKPSSSPSSSRVPTFAPTVARSDTPSTTPSIQPTAKPSFKPSMSNQTSLLANSTNTTTNTTTNTSNQTSLSGNSTNTTTTTTDSDIFNRSKAPAPAPTESTASMSFDTVLLSLVFSVDRLRLLQTFNRTLLLDITSQHLLTELRKFVANPDDVADVHLILTRVEFRGETVNRTFTVVEAVDGQIAFSERVALSLRNEVVQEMVLHAFSNDALQRYETELQDSTDFGNIQQVFMGMPPKDTSNNTTNDSVSSSFSSGFTWNVFWIAIVAGGGVLVLGVILASCCLIRRFCVRRHSMELLQVKASTTDKSSPTAPARDEPVNAMGVDDDLASVDDESRAGRYPQSEITSVYSYLDGNSTMLDDQSYSMGPSMMYGLAMPGDDQSMHSRMWSVADGLNQSLDNSLADYYVAPPGEKDREPPGESGRVLIFSDGDDDDISMVSEANLALSTDKTRQPMQIIGIESKKTTDYSSPYEKADWSLNDYTGDDASEASDAESLGRYRIPFSNLSRVDEMSKNSSMVSSSSVSSRDTRKSASSRKSATGGTKNTENLLNDRSMEIGESSDDESLFMGPNIILGSEQVVALDESNKVSSRGPLPRGTATLTDQEKQHMGLGASPSRDASEGDRGTFSLPQAYLTSEEKKDDTSVNATDLPKASADVITSVASF